MAEGKKITMIPFPIIKDAFRAEVLLKKAGFKVRLTAPPPELRTGCDIAAEIDPRYLVPIRRILETNDIEFHDVVYGDRVIPFLELTKTFDLGEYVMVRHACMKITYEKATSKIVNISGGGCPDVPYVVTKMLGKTLEGTTHPQLIGTTICTYALGKAYEKALEIWKKKAS
ncbi:MAG: DUF3343 domain-containing protein [Candidatus Bathyarchaeia archaeon]